MSRYYGGWRPYVPVAQRRARAIREMEKLRKSGVDIQPVTIEGRAIARSFWGKEWCTHLESFGDFSNRLPRGRTYVRNGSVCHLAISKGAVEAVVSGSELYEVTVKINPLKEPKWAKLRQQCTGKIGSLIELLQGRLSDEILAIVTDRQEGLFPLPGEIRYNCNCPDWAGMCKHIAAVIYGIGARLDERPEWLFTLRGVDHEDLISPETSVESIAGGGSARSRRRSLAGQNLESVFGVELEESSSAEAKPAGRKAGNKKAVKKKVAGQKVGKKKAAKKKVVKRVKPAANARKTARRKSAAAPNRKEKERRAAPFKPSARSIAALRCLLDMDKSEFARAVGVSPVTITKWETSSGPLILHHNSLAELTKLYHQACNKNQ